METAPVFNDRAKQLEEKRQNMITTLAALLHESWRKRQYVSGEYTPRIKTTIDKRWIDAHGGLAQIDIANTPFAELPADWQEENLLSAKVAIEKMEEVLYLIHDNWLDRNDQSASEEQKVQYSRLPSHEKLKDIDILEGATRVMKENVQKETI
ncbi:MAG: hypothetical protein WC847_00985 [Candidatus Paceibacterota bacterium]|jgi:hypothetical protein